jgi:hypothetical protein
MRDDDEKVIALENRLEAEQQSFESPIRLLNEAKAINQIVQNIAVGDIQYGADATETGGQRVVLLYTDTTQSPLSVSEAAGFKLWLQTRLNTSELLLIVSPQPTLPTTSVNTTTTE